MQAIIEQIRFNSNGVAQALVVFTDGATIKTDPQWQDITATDLTTFTAQLQTKGNVIPTQFNFANSLTPGQVIDLTVTTTPTDPSIVARNKFFRDWGMYQQLQTLVNLGILTGQEKEYTNLKSTVQSEYQPSYFA